MYTYQIIYADGEYTYSEETFHAQSPKVQSNMLNLLCDISKAGHKVELLKSKKIEIAGTTIYRRLSQSKESPKRTRVAREVKRLAPKTIRRKPQQSYIYFIATPGFIKIGRSNDPDSRIAGIQTSAPVPIEKIAVIPESESLTESMLHQRFKHLRNHREWFTDCEELREYINQLT